MVPSIILHSVVDIFIEAVRASASKPNGKGSSAKGVPKKYSSSTLPDSGCSLCGPFCKKSALEETHRAAAPPRTVLPPSSSIQLDLFGSNKRTDGHECIRPG